MSEDKNIFSIFTPKKVSFVSYVDSNKGKIVSFGLTDKYPNPTIEDILLLEGLKHN